MKLFALRDLKSKLYYTPLWHKTVADATRSFSIMVNDDRSESMISKFPGDFRLHHLADFDSETGELTPQVPPQDLGCAVDFLSPDRQTVLPFVKSKAKRKSN